MEQEKGRRPYILLAGDCSHAAYIFRPQGEDTSNYELWAEINCGGTVGSLAVTHLPLFSQEDGHDDSGWAKLFIPNFDANKVRTCREDQQLLNREAFLFLVKESYGDVISSWCE